MIDVHSLFWVLYALEDRYLSASPRGYINCWSGTEVGLTQLGAPNLPYIVGLASLLLINRHETSVRGPAQSFKEEYAAHNNNNLFWGNACYV